MIEVHLISRQVGTAYPFVEFYKLFESSGFIVKSFIYAPSIVPFQAANVPYEIINSFDEYLKLQDSSPAVIMTGTSLEVNDDAKYWMFAKTIRASSVAWVDQPINLTERFSVGRPNIVLANDRHTLTHLHDIGIVEDCLCFGSPYLSSLLKKIKRNNLLPKTIFFASEPYFENRSDYLARDKSPNRIKYGCDDVDALIYAFKLLTHYHHSTGDNWNIVVRPHPCDNILRLNKAFSAANQGVAHLTFTDLSKEKILEVAPVIVGMRSMFLFEAACLGIPTISLQPGQISSWPFMESHESILALKGDENDIHKFTKMLMNLKDNKPEVQFDVDSIVKLFNRLGAENEKKDYLHS